MQEVLSLAPSDSELEGRARSLLRWKIRFNSFAEITAKKSISPICLRTIRLSTQLCKKLTRLECFR